MTAQAIAQAIANTLAVQWPTRPIYQDFCPADFCRPACFLWCSQSERRDINVALVEWEVQLELELFCETDDYDLMSTQGLRREQELVLGLFSHPKIAVSNPDTGERRFIQLEANAQGQAPGSAFVGFVARWVDKRPGLRAEDTPNMAHYQLRLTERTRDL